MEQSWADAHSDWTQGHSPAWKEQRKPEQGEEADGGVSPGAEPGLPVLLPLGLLNPSACHPSVPPTRRVCKPKESLNHRPIGCSLGQRRSQHRSWMCRNREHPGGVSSTAKHPGQAVGLGGQEPHWSDLGGRAGPSLSIPSDSWYLLSA